MEQINKSIVYAAVQNGVILDVFDSRDEAVDCVNEEIKKDFLTIMFKRKLRKLFRKSGNIALHQYSVMKVVEVSDIK